MRGDDHNLTRAISVAPLVGDDIPAGAAMDRDVLQPRGKIQCCSLVTRPSGRIGIMDAE
jgi:hypothetical protein